VNIKKVTDWNEQRDAVVLEFVQKEARHLPNLGVSIGTSSRRAIMTLESCRTQNDSKLDRLTVTEDST
jgi:hypothetical protein